MQILRADTITEVTIGCAISVADSFTPVTTLSIAGADEAEIIKHGATTTTPITGTLSAITGADGYYALDLSATDTDTEGRFTILINDDSLILPVKHQFMVVSANVYDSLYAPATTDYLQTDAVQISSDTLAADNLEATFDGTGYVDAKAPGTQHTLGMLSVGSAGIAINAASFTKTVGGAETGSIASTTSADGVFHTVEDLAGNTDIYYEFVLQGDEVATDLYWEGYARKKDDDYGVFSWDWVAASWVQLGEIEGKNGTGIMTETFTPVLSMTGTGADLGKVRFRFQSTNGTDFATDRIYCEYTVVSRTVGYSNGAIWIDTNDGAAGTEIYVNGVADNPVNTLADALTLSTNGGLKHFTVTPGSVITLTAGVAGKVFDGEGYQLALAGQDISNCHVSHAHAISGTATATAVWMIDHGIFMDVTIPAGGYIHQSAMKGVVTLGEPGAFHLHGCYADSDSGMTLDFAVVGNVTLYIHQWDGKITFANMSTGDNVHIAGAGQIITTNCSGGHIHVQGEFRYTDAGGNIMLLQSDAKDSLDDVQTKVIDVQTRIPTAAELTYMVDNSATGTPVTFTTAGGGITTAVLNLVDGAAASAVDEQYTGRLLVFTDGTLKGVVTDITSYTGGTTTATITGIPTAPLTSHNARMI